MVGDAHAEVAGVAIALDPTVSAVRAAKACGANILLTHHPVFLDAPATVRPAQDSVFGSETVVWEAVASGVALMNFHTALDTSKAAAHVLPSMLGMHMRGILDETDRDRHIGYGQICTIDQAERPYQLKTLAARCLAVFGRPARVWGDMDKFVETCVTATGSASELIPLCIAQKVDCLVCGEIRYHDALAACEAGLAIIELGHDVSELPLCAVLGAALEHIGFPEAHIKAIDQSMNWTTPEAIRK
jgi:putative NIF3 family GTP cyclohydrolase 1 type 2